MGRLAFAPYIALDEGLGVFAAIKKSWQMTSGHWFEVVAAVIASAITLPYGLISFVGLQSGLIGRYLDIKELKAKAAKKPQVHWMNFLLVGLGIVVACFYAVFVVATIRAMSDNSNGSCTTAPMSVFDTAPLCSNYPTMTSPIDKMDNMSPAN